MTFAEKMKKCREELGVSQARFGMMTGLSPNYIALLETGKRTPGRLAAKKISKFFEKSVDN